MFENITQNSLQCASFVNVFKNLQQEVNYRDPFSLAQVFQPSVSNVPHTNNTYVNATLFISFVIFKKMRKH